MIDNIRFNPRMKGNLLTFDGERWIKLKSIYIDMKTESKSSKISTLGNFVENQCIAVVRYISGLDENFAIELNGEHYHILSVENILNKNRFNRINCCKVNLEECNIKRLVTSKDNRGRATQELKELYTYPGILTKKYIKYIQDKPNATYEEEFIFVFPHSCDIKTADIIEVNGKNYVVKSSFSPVNFRVEVEANLKVDA